MADEFTPDERAAVIASVVGSQALAGVAVTPEEAGALLDGLAGTPLPPIGAGLAGGGGRWARGSRGQREAGMAITEADLARIWGAPELVPSYRPGGDPDNGAHWEMEQTVENFIRNPLVAMGWPREVRVALVREVQQLRADVASAEGCYHWRRNDCTPAGSE